MFSILRQPYTVLEPASAQVRNAVLIGLFIGLFLLVFQPFGLGEWETESKWLKIAGFGLISFGVTAIHFTLWPTLFPRFFAEKNWTVSRAIGYILLNILLIAVGNFLYLGYLLNLPFAWIYLFWMIVTTLVVGLFPATGVILYGYIQRLRKYGRSATVIQAQSPTLSTHAASTREMNPTQFGENPVATLTLIADNEKDRLSLSPTDLLFIESSDNYCTVYHLQNDKLQKPLLRSSLSRLETQVSGFPRLVRCHRSFVVNLDRVERITGNAQGYKLHLLNGELEVPVARRYNETLVAGLRAV